MLVLAFLTQAKGQEGLQFLDTFSVEDRLYAFSLLGMGVSFLCYSAPLGRLWVLIKKRDAALLLRNFLLIILMWTYSK